MADFRKTIDDMSYKLGEVHGILTNWQTSCADTHKRVDARIGRLEAGVIATLLGVIGLLIKLFLGV